MTGRNRSAFVCVSIDEFPFTPVRAETRTGKNGVFKRPHSSTSRQFRRTVARPSPPAFLFPNQRCQRPGPPWRPHRLAPGVGGGGYLVAPEFRVNRLFRAFSLRLARPTSERKNHCGKPEASLGDRCDSAEAREVSRSDPINQGVFVNSSTASGGCFPERSGVSSCRSDRCQPPLFRDPRFVFGLARFRSKNVADD